MGPTCEPRVYPQQNIGAAESQKISHQPKETHQGKLKKIKKSYVHSSSISKICTFPIKPKSNKINNSSKLTHDPIQLAIFTNNTQNHTTQINNQSTHESIMLKNKNNNQKIQSIFHQGTSSTPVSIWAF